MALDFRERPQPNTCELDRNSLIRSPHYYTIIISLSRAKVLSSRTSVLLSSSKNTESIPTPTIHPARTPTTYTHTHIYTYTHTALSLSPLVPPPPQPPTTMLRNRPARHPRVLRFGVDPTPRRPGFDYARPAQTRDEAAVRAEGYAWVQTNVLTPHWMRGVGPTTTPETLADRGPDRLAPHGHHSPNTHRIVKGRLTLRQVDPHRRGRSHHSEDEEGEEEEEQEEEEGEEQQQQQEEQEEQDDDDDDEATMTIADDGLHPVSAPVRAGVLYEGTTSEDAGCAFVEGHACLSPTTALRFMRRGTLRWFGADGAALPDAEQTYVMAQLARAHTVRSGGRGRGRGRGGGGGNEVSFVMTGRRAVAYDLTEWFEEEWQDLERVVEGGWGAV